MCMGDPEGARPAFFVKMSTSVGDQWGVLGKLGEAPGVYHDYF